LWISTFGFLKKDSLLIFLLSQTSMSVRPVLVRMVASAATHVEGTLVSVLQDSKESTASKVSYCMRDYWDCNTIPILGKCIDNFQAIVLARFACFHV